MEGFQQISWSCGASCLQWQPATDSACHKYSGISMTCPHVSGAAERRKSTHPSTQVGRPASSRGHHSPAHGLPQRRNDSRRMCMCMCVACCLKGLVPICTIPICKVVVCWHLEQDFCSCRYHPPCFQDAHRLQNMSGFDGVRRDSLLPEEGYMEVMEASWSHTRPGL